MIPADDLSLRNLWNLTLHHWRENPIVARMWKKLRVKALVVGLCSFVILYLWSQLVAKIFGAPTSWLSSLPYQVLHLAILILALSYPVLIALWCYKKSYTRMEEWRLAPFSFADRLMGILIPASAAYIAYALVNPVIETAIPLVKFLASDEVITFNPVTLLQHAAWHLSNGASVLAFVVFIITVNLRTLIAWESKAMSALGKIVFVAIPYIMILLFSVGLTFAQSLLYRITAWAGFSTTSIGLYYLAIMLVYPILLFLVMRSLWRRDLPRARDTLFRLEG